ncbi:MAG: branched-chain amino acid ABC transporter permease [Betaproteobacteria bacterium]|nr:branched-chain amino acid ABC transporter permease [Betaproteobacteria bacterium]MDE2424078.1 branched-chain amino acid ABC transporter permease [Betaproteobacteria bacterium]
MRIAIYLILLIIGAVLPHFVYPVLLMKILCFAIFACAFNLLLGFSGLLSFGHAAFFGGAAYVSGYLIKNLELPTEVAIIGGVLSAALMGWLVGILAIRRQGIYFAMVTLALAQMVYFICLEAPITGGEDGMQGIPRGSFLGLSLKDDLTLYYVIFTGFILAFLIIYRTIHSPFGQVLKAIRENESRAISLGYDVPKYKLLAFVISAAFAGFAGILKMLVFNFATLTDVHWHMSGDVVLMTIFGGIGTILGPVVGSSIIITLEDQLTDSAGDMVTVIMGVIFVVCVLIFRKGIVGESVALYQRMLGRKNLPQVK